MVASYEEPALGRQRDFYATGLGYCPVWQAAIVPSLTHLRSVLRARILRIKISEKKFIRIVKRFIQLVFEPFFI